jgi:hypothetical protein
MLSTKRRPLEIRAGSAVRQIIRRINRTGGAWFASCNRPWSTSDFDLGLKCFSDTSVDILFDFVNALKNATTRSSQRDLISDALPLIGSVMAD